MVNILIFVLRVVAKVKNTYVPIPVNINTVNLLLNENITSPKEMNKWLNKYQIKFTSLKNGEEAGLSRVGEKLYEILFKNYTFKQWSKYPKELNASVLLRIPVVHNYDDRYFPHDNFQALPQDGYTNFIKNMLTHKNIKILLNTDYFEMKLKGYFNIERTVYTGPIDQYFIDSGLPLLEYRSIKFKTETFHNTSFYQPNAVINYPNGPEQFTRIVEYKHLLAQRSRHTTIVKEFTTDKGEPYYPVPTKKNQELYNKYKMMALKEEKNRNVHFVGRLANYKYFNMDAAILNAINIFGNITQISMNFSNVKVNTRSTGKTISLTVIVDKCDQDLYWINHIMEHYDYQMKIVIYKQCKRVNVTHLFPKYSDSIIQLDFLNDAGPGYSWLNFILSKQSLFGDINIFSYGKPSFSIDNLDTKLKMIISNGKISFMNNRNVNIVPEKHYLPLSPNEYRTFPGMRKAHTYQMGNKTCNWIRNFIKPCSCFLNMTFYGEFIITEALMRRVLVKFRWPLNQMYNKHLTVHYPHHILEQLWKIVFTI